MIRVSSVSAISSIGAFLRDSGYDVAHLGHEFDLVDGLYANHENLELLLAKTESLSTLAVLARLFFVCWPVEAARCSAVLPESFLTGAIECGLLEADDNHLVSTAFLVPFRSLIIACDSSSLLNKPPDMVIGTGAATHFLARLAVGGSDETTLDLGTGTGVLALEAARYSRKVVGTDINPRALQFAAFNAVLNGIDGLEWRCGDAFAPIAGERFTRVLANPPFFLSPAKAFTHCDNPMELDGFSGQLASECSAYLDEGGFYQMICEWVEIEGEPWDRRLREWTSQSKCDVLVLVAPRLTPLSYTERRTKDARLMQASASEPSFADRLKYLTDRRVKHVIGGVITMRKRSGGANWFKIIGTEPVGSDVGLDFRARFDTLTFLATANDEQMFTSRFQLAPDVVLEKRAMATASAWHTSEVDLLKRSDLIDRLRLDETVSMFLPLFNGVNTLAEMAGTVAEHLQIDGEDARQRCLQLAKRLLQSNFVGIA